MNAREEIIGAFLDSAGWGAAERNRLAGDASTRRYERLKRGAEEAILMDQPPGAETAACPPDATPEEREALGYNAIARLAGPNVRAFAAIGGFLRERGFSAPAILAHDYDNGLLLLEDLGDDLFNRVFANGVSPLELYPAACTLLAELHAHRPPADLPLDDGSAYSLLTYDRTALEAEVRLLTDWYLPAIGITLDDGTLADYLAAWNRAWADVAEDTSVLVLRDYHADNLIWLPERSGPARIGLLDFQDGLRGHGAYDLVSLLQDARRDVTQAEEQAGYEAYVQAARTAQGGFDPESFAAAYAVFNAQRNAKIVGIFTRLWRRDGRPAYPPMVPRVWGYLGRALEHPALEPVRAWMDETVPPHLRGDP
ncbi:MAG: aminoglycoside phosphotransferase family protein, partial [Alphaproteobacteria bacterium]